MNTPKKMNRFERVKAEGDALALAAKLESFAAAGAEEIPPDDIERLKVWGLALRPKTPGYFMLRVRVPAGQLTAEQARTLGTTADAFGRGACDITARAQLQLRWINIADVPEVFRRLRDCGLATLQTLMDSVRNIRGCPLAGLTPHEHFDATPVIRAIEARIVGNADAINLPRKMNVTVSGCACHCCDADIQDLALVPARRRTADGDELGFNVLVGGKTSAGDFHTAQPLDAFVTPDEAPALVEHVMGLFRDHGPRQTRARTRLVYLLQAWGLPRFRDELAARLGRPLPPAGQDLRAPERCETVGILPQKQRDLVAVGLHVPVGRITGNQLTRLGKLAEAFGSGGLRLTSEQNVIIPNVRRDRLPDLLADPLLRCELRPNPHPIERGTVSCTGVEYCTLAIIETKQRAQELAEELARRLPGAPPLRIHWSGCRAGCGQHLTADIGLLGRKVQRGDQLVEAADVFIGGSSGPGVAQAKRVLEAVPCGELADTIERVIRERRMTTDPPAN